MKLFKKKEKKQENEDGGIWIVKMALQEAMRELQEEREKNESLRKDLEIYDNKDKVRQAEVNEITNLQNNLEVLQNTIENIRKLCKDKNGKTISSLAILKELGE